MWPNPQEIADLFTFTEKIHNEKLHFLCSANCQKKGKFFRGMKKSSTVSSQNITTFGTVVSDQKISTGNLKKQLQ